jgi:hypothetical protein
VKSALSAWCLVLGVLCLVRNCFSLGSSAEPCVVAPPRNSQVQVARRFWLAVLRHDDRAAYAFLASDVRRTMPSAVFRQRAGLVRAAAHGHAIELYKLGFRLEDDGRARPFVAFSYAADSALPGKRQGLDVTFRDTAARAVWRFEWVMR